MSDLYTEMKEATTEVLDRAAAQLTEDTPYNLRTEVGLLVGTELEDDVISHATHLAMELMQDTMGRLAGSQGPRFDPVRAGRTSCGVMFLTALAIGQRMGERKAEALLPTGLELTEYDRDVLSGEAG